MNIFSVDCMPGLHIGLQTETIPALSLPREGQPLTFGTSHNTQGFPCSWSPKANDRPQASIPPKAAYLPNEQWSRWLPWVSRGRFKAGKGSDCEFSDGDSRRVGQQTTVGVGGVALRRHEQRLPVSREQPFPSLWMAFVNAGVVSCFRIRAASLESERCAEWNERVQ